MKVKMTDKDSTTEREIPDQILTFREGSGWIAAWRHYDLVAAGKTKNEARAKLFRAMSSHCYWDGVDGRKPFENVLPPPQEVLADWERQHRAEHENEHANTEAKKP